MTTPNSHSPSLVASVGVQCHVGRERTENQDRVTRAATPFGDLFVLADGVGGYQGGSEAAQATVAGIVDYVKAHGNLALPDALQHAARAVSTELQRRSAANPALHGMGSTVVLCVVDGDRATYAHAGDSRAYLWRDRELKQLTRDHSVMERLISQGVLTPAQAREHPDASVLTRAIGPSAEVSLDVAEILLQPNDALLLCSDGLWAYASHKEMEAVISSESLSPSAVATALLNLALEGGGGDNISIQFIRFKAAEVHPASHGGMSRGVTISAVTLASVLALGTAWGVVWNRRHPFENPNPPASVEVAEAAPPVTREEHASSGAKPDAASAPSATHEASPSKTTGKPAVKTPAKAASRSSQPAPASANSVSRYSITIIRGKNNSEADWASQLDSLDYLIPSRQAGNDQCLALGNSVALLLHSPEKAKVAAQVQQSLGLDDSAVVQRSSAELRACGGADLIALPAKPSMTDVVVEKTKAGGQAAKSGIESGAQTLKKKAREASQAVHDNK